jgi:mercuric ion transport protein
MSDIEGKLSATKQSAIVSGAVVFTIGGLAAAFGAASCCALPLLLTTLGVSTAWLGGVTLAAGPYRVALLVIGGLLLLGGAVLLWRHQRAAATCSLNGVCARPVVRVLTLVGLVFGAGLLWAGFTYA